MNKNMTRIAELLDLAYANLLSDNFDHDFVVGCVAEAKAIAEGDKGSFDNQHEIDDAYANAYEHDAKMQAQCPTPDEYENPSDYVGMGWIDSRGRP